MIATVGSMVYARPHADRAIKGWALSPRLCATHDAHLDVIRDDRSVFGYEGRYAALTRMVTGAILAPRKTQQHAVGPNMAHTPRHYRGGGMYVLT